MAPFEPRGIQPTPEQRAIQFARHPRVIVQANAGAAKTTSLVLRLGQALVEGVAPGRIQVLTYTDAAVQAFGTAMARAGLDTATRRSLHVQTFAQFCTQRLSAAEGPGVRQLRTPEALKPHVLSALQRVLDNPDDRHRDAFSLADADDGNVEGLLATFAKLKGRLALQTELGERSLTPDVADEMGCDYISLRAFTRYEHERRGGHPDRPAFRGPHDATYDLARWLLEPDNAPLAEGLSPCLDLGLQLLLVDEMHDCNRAMFTLLGQLLTHNPGCSFIGVGDRDQVIHGEAGADAAFMGHTFDTDIGMAEHLPLHASFRFGPQLAQAVSRLANKPYEARSPHDTAVRLYAVHTDQGPGHEARQVLALLANLDGLPTGTAPGDLAVLLRQPHQSVALESLMLSRGLAYRTAGLQPFLMRPEILCVRALMAHAFGQFDQIEPVATREAALHALVMVAGALVDLPAEEDAPPVSDEEALAPASDDQATQLARLRATEAAIKQVAAYPQLATGFIDNQVLRNAHPVALRRLQAALAVLRDAATGTQSGPASNPDWAQAFLAALDAPTLAQRVRVNAQDVQQFSANLAALAQTATGFESAQALCRALNSWSLRLGAMRPSDCVLISSIEAAKGLEFEHVIIPGLNRGEFMVGHSVADTRNLLYVALTRARRKLSLLARHDRPSPFLHDAGLL